MKEYCLGKLAAIITQNAHCFFDRELAPYGIGWGQQFLLLRIHENEGSSILELAKRGFLDQSTTTRALQKLEQLGYIRYEVNPGDRRIRQVYTTEKAKPVIEAALMALQEWERILIQNMAPEEACLTRRLMERMARNAFETLHGEEGTAFENMTSEENENNVRNNKINRNED